GRLPLLAGRCGWKGLGRNPAACSFKDQREFSVGGLGGPERLAGRRHQPWSVRGSASQPAATEGPPGPPALPALHSNSCRASAASLKGRAGDLQPAMLEHPPSPLWAPELPEPPQPAPTPCSVAPSPIHRPRAEERGCSPRDWRAAQPAAQVRNLLGEARWAPESGGDLENFRV
uniref:Uncharacterized protein n=1 Tax=Macaca fascicularis TaxID=9541 RepID=A0A7N9IEX1_MACFA